MDWKHFFSQVNEVLTTEFFRIGDTAITLSTVLIILLIIIITLRGSRGLRRAVEQRLSKRGGSEGAVGAASALLHYATLAVGFSVAAQTAGINLTGLFAAGAVFAVGIGFAMQNIAQNFVSGIILMVERSIRPGDVIDVEGRPVKVLRMGIRSAVVQTRDAEDIIVPNASLVQSSVTNYTMEHSDCRMRLRVGVAYKEDMRLVRKTLQETADAYKGVPGKGGEVLLVDFGDNAVVFEIAVWIKDAWRMGVLRAQLAEQIWWALQEANITIAFPQLDVHLDAPVERGIESLAARAA